jgi:hypothetical protein
MIELVTLHVAILLLTFAVVVYADHQGFNYLTGRKQVLSKRSVLISHWLVFLGLVGMIASGLSMAWPLKEYYFAEPVFIIKMFFVAALFINGIAISHLMHFATTTPFVELSAGKKKALFISGAISTISWIGAASIGLFFL